MGQLVIVAGKSGMGKSFSLRRMNPKKTLLIKAISKPLPFPEKKLGWKNVQNGGNVFIEDDPAIVKAIVEKAYDKGFKSVVVDDATYTMINEMMRRSAEKNFDKWVDFAKNTWELANTVRNMPDDFILYLIWHTEELPTGSLKLKTVGKMTDEKIDIPALATVVLLATKQDRNNVFKTQAGIDDFAKSPVGMFDNEYIQNDLALVDDSIREYYGEEKLGHLEKDPVLGS